MKLRKVGLILRWWILVAGRIGCILRSIFRLPSLRARLVFVDHYAIAVSDVNGLSSNIIPGLSTAALLVSSQVILSSSAIVQPRQYPVRLPWARQ